MLHCKTWPISSTPGCVSARPDPHPHPRTLDVIRRLAIALTVSADELIFGKDERGPDEDLRLQFEAISQFDDEDKELARGLLEGLILKHQAKQSVMRQAARNAPAKTAAKTKRKATTAAHR